MNNEDAVHALLALCARARMPAGLLDELARRAAAVENWNVAFGEAERHGLAPLLYVHLRTAKVKLPAVLQRQAAALFLRHRRANEIRIKVLGEVLDAFAARGVDVRLLKGAALIPLVYGDASLRPVSDLDLLVPVRDALRAQDVLRGLGFVARHPTAKLDHHHHLPVALRMEEGIPVNIEIHHDALAKDHGLSIALGPGREAPLPIDVGSREALALGPHEMLRHLCLHLVGPLPRPLRLIWIADLVGFVELCAPQLDWARLQAQDPVLMNVLAVAHNLTPFPDGIAARIPSVLRTRFQPMAARGDMWAWAAPREEGGGHWKRMRRALSPPSWWLMLKYGREGAVPAWLLRSRHLPTVFRVSARRAPSGFAETGAR